LVGYCGEQRHEGGGPAGFVGLGGALQCFGDELVGVGEDPLAPDRISLNGSAE